MCAHVLGKLAQGWQRQIKSTRVSDDESETICRDIPESSYMQAKPSLPIGCVKATVFSFAMYLSGDGIEHNPNDAITRISRTICLLVTIQHSMYVTKRIFCRGGGRCTNEISLGARILSHLAGRQTGFSVPCLYQ